MKDFCECCMSGKAKRIPLKLYNSYGNKICDCVKYICHDCMNKPEVLQDFLEDSAKKCSRENACDFVNPEKIKKILSKKKNETHAGIIIYGLPLITATLSMIFFDGYLARELYSSLIAIATLAVCLVVYNKK